MSVAVLNLDAFTVVLKVESVFVILCCVNVLSMCNWPVIWISVVARNWAVKGCLHKEVDVKLIP